MSEITEIHEPLMKWLSSEKIPFVRVRSDRESTIREGWPDFTICLNGAVLFIEAKVKGGRVSDEQRICIGDLEAAGNVVVVAWSLQEAVEAVQTWRSTGMVAKRRESAFTPNRLGIAQDGTNGDFVFRYSDGFWARLRRASLEDAATLPRIDRTQKPT